MFDVSVKRSFRAAHALCNYRGGKEQAHEHNWLVEVVICANKLDQAGCAVDFVKIDAALDKILSPISEKTLDEVLVDTSPSTENLARYIYGKISSEINNNIQTVARVTAWEDEDHSASYYE